MKIFLLTVICLLITPVSALADDDAWKDWKPVDPSLLALKAPIVEKDADAEAIFWEVQVDFKPDRAILINYVRIKIYTDRGKESQSRVDLSYFGKNIVEQIAGRTIKPDGAIIELKNDAIFERTIAKASGLKLRARSFAMPAVEPGAIIEYRWREVRQDQRFLRLYFQRDIPVQLLKCAVKVNSNVGAMRFNMRSSPLARDNDGFYSATLTNVPALREEPYMPPDNTLRSWILLYYLPAISDELAIIRGFHELSGSAMKPNDEIRRAAAALMGDASTPEQKLERLFEFCRSKIKNVDEEASFLTTDKVKENKTPADTMKRGMGTGKEINLLFGSLATAAGFVAREAYVVNRSDVLYKPRNDIFINFYFMGASNIGVQFGNEWRFFDPASKHIPYGMLRWQEEGSSAMMFDPYQVFYRETPMSQAEKSLEKRTAKFRLSEDGALEGDVRIEYTGHLSVEKREENGDLSPAKREENLRDSFKEKMGTTEISDIRIENVADPMRPLIYLFHVRVPGYAQRTGKRLFLQPAFFQKRSAALFSSGERRHPIYFHYHWSELDTVEIDLPPGYVIDAAESPAPLTTPAQWKYDVKITTTEDKRALIYKRSLSFGAGGISIFPRDNYNELKRMFDAMIEKDNQTITLRREAAGQ